MMLYFGKLEFLIYIAFFIYLLAAYFKHLQSSLL